MPYITSVRFVRVLGLLAALVVGRGDGAEYFVGKQGNDGNDGRSRERAFLTIQRGLDALQTGDVLTIGPGEYLEHAARKDLGGADADTVIRAEIPGTAVLRGDVPAPAFRPVKGYRFIYAATFEQTPHAVLEHHGFRTLLPAVSVAELEFDPGHFHYDPATKTLAITNADLAPPDGLRYTVAVDGKHGLALTKPRRVVVEGLAASGFYPGWCINLESPESCVVRGCVLSKSAGGVRIAPVGDSNQREGGANNVVEGCESFAHTFAGVAAYSAKDLVVRNCRTYRSFREGEECFGVMHYHQTNGPLTIADNVSWGQSFDYSVKPKGAERLERCVGLGFIRNATMSHNLIGGGNEYDRQAASTPADNILFKREHGLDQDAEFADPLNLDFRLQPESRFRGNAPDGGDRGPAPYRPNIFYVAPGGSDDADGLSMKKPWRTLARALSRVRPGDTIYLAAGEYAAADWKQAGDGTAPVRILGRGRGTVVIDGAWKVGEAAQVSCERLHFSGKVTVAKGRNVTFRNCVFFDRSGGGGLGAEGVTGLTVEHCVFVGTPLDLGGSAAVRLGGNLHAGQSGPAVRIGNDSGILHADRSAYQDATRCWLVAGAVRTLAEVQKRHERHSQVITPQFATEGGVPRLVNEVAFRSLGPHGSTIGIHHEYDPSPDRIRIVGPFVFSAHDTTANIEWWSTHPATYTIAWGDTPEMKHTIEGVPGPQRFNTYSLSGLEPGKTYHFAIRHAKATGIDSVNPLPEVRPEKATVSFTTAKEAAAPKTWHVAPDGDDGHDGLARTRAFRTLNRAALAAGPGDTVEIAGGDYDETVRIRAAGTPERPITFRAAAGERPVIRGEKLSRAFEVHVKPDLRFDGLTFGGFDMFSSVFLVRQSPRARFERCLNAMVTASESPELVVRNCTLRGGWSAVGLDRCPGAVVEHDVFVMTILRHVTADAPAIVRDNVFCECIRGKAHQTLLELSPQVKESNNCFYVRWPEDEKLAISNRPLTEYRLRTGSDSLAANPMMSGSPGSRQGWQQADRDGEADKFFTGNPALVVRGIGLEPEAFRGIRRGPASWPFDKAWAEGILAAMRSADKLAGDGKNAEALSAYLELTAKWSMPDRLKADLLERASRCAEQLGKDDQAMELAKSIPIEPLAMRRRMQLLLAKNRHAELIDTFTPAKMGGKSFVTSFIYPEAEDLMADLHDLRARAYIGVNDLAAAEADLKLMNEKRVAMQYRSGEAIHDRAWMRLGDFYRDQLHDEGRALEAYRNVCDRTTWDYWGRPPKPVARGADDVLVAATTAACDILRKQGKDDEARGLRVSLLRAQAAAAAGRLDRAAMLARCAEAEGIDVPLSSDQSALDKRLAALDRAGLAAVLPKIAAEATALGDDVRALLVEAAADDDAAARKNAIRTIVRFAPGDKATALLDAAMTESRTQAARASLEPKLKRLRELTDSKQWQKLVDEFKATKFADWEDRKLAAEAVHLRGMAYFQLKKAKQAEADIKQGLELAAGGYTTERWYWLAENYRVNLQDESRALESYGKIVGSQPGWAVFDANLKAAAILWARKQKDEAVAILRAANLEVASGAWREKTLAALEAALVDMGRRDEAVTAYKNVLALPNLSAAEKATFEKRLSALGAGG